VYRRHGDSETGLSTHDALRILSSNGKKINSMELQRIVETLSAEGVLYTTIDDLHYKSTDAP